MFRINEETIEEAVLLLTLQYTHSSYSQHKGLSSSVDTLSGSTNSAGHFLPIAINSPLEQLNSTLAVTP